MHPYIEPREVKQKNCKCEKHFFSVVCVKNDFTEASISKPAATSKPAVTSNHAAISDSKYEKEVLTKIELTMAMQTIIIISNYAQRTVSARGKSTSFTDHNNLNNQQTISARAEPNILADDINSTISNDTNTNINNDAYTNTSSNTKNNINN